MSEAITTKGKLRIHLLVPATSGPIQSAPGGTTIRVGTDQRYQVACDPGITMSKLHRGTTEPYAVHCDACRATDVFKAVDRPKPGLHGSDDLTTEGCC